MDETRGSFISYFVTLFVKVLTMYFNALFHNSDFKRFGMPKWSDNINHLAYAANTIIFVYAYKIFLNIIMKTLCKLRHNIARR